MIDPVAEGGHPHKNSSSLAQFPDMSQLSHPGPINRWGGSFPRKKATPLQVHIIIIPQSFTQGTCGLLLRQLH